MTRNPDPSILTVAKKRCDQCLFSTAKIVDDERRDEVLEHCRRTGQAFECHKATIAGEHVVCRGFYDADVSLVIRLGKALGRVRFVSLPADDRDRVSKPEDTRRGGPE